MAVVPLLDGPVRMLWNRDRESLPRVHHCDGALPGTLTGGRLIEGRIGGDGCRLRRRPRIGRRRHAWRRSERSGFGRCGGDYRRISRRIAHSERLDICQGNKVADCRQRNSRHRCRGNVRRRRRYGKHRWCGAHVAHNLSAVSNQNSHEVNFRRSLRCFQWQLAPLVARTWATSSPSDEIEASNPLPYAYSRVRVLCVLALP